MSVKKRLSRAREMLGHWEGDTFSFTKLPSTYTEGHVQLLLLKVETLGSCLPPLYFVHVAPTRELGYQGHMSAKCPTFYSVPMYKMRIHPFQRTTK